MTARPRRGDPEITPALVAEHRLTAEEYDRLVGMLGRTPTFTELGVVSAEGNVLGMMPHPERASDPVLGSDDGLGIFQSVLERVSA